MPFDGTSAPDDGAYFRPQSKADRVFLRSIGVFRWRGRGARIEKGSQQHRAILRYMRTH